MKYLILIGLLLSGCASYEFSQEPSVPVKKQGTVMFNGKECQFKSLYWAIARYTRIDEKLPNETALDKCLRSWLKVRSSTSAEEYISNCTKASEDHLKTERGQQTINFMIEARKKRLTQTPDGNPESYVRLFVEIIDGDKHYAYLGTHPAPQPADGSALPLIAASFVLEDGIWKQDYSDFMLDSPIRIDLQKHQFKRYGGENWVAPDITTRPAADK